LVHEYSVIKQSNGLVLTIRGLSVVNGAQTTGAIGSSGDVPKIEALVPARFVKCSDQRP
jgi:hypothetical protein